MEEVSVETRPMGVYWTRVKVVASYECGSNHFTRSPNAISTMIHHHDAFNSKGAFN